MENNYTLSGLALILIARLNGWNNDSDTLSQLKPSTATSLISFQDEKG